VGAAVSWWGRVSSALRATPIVLRVPLIAVVVLMLCSIMCVFLRLEAAATVFFGAFGMSGVALGLVVIADASGSAAAIHRLVAAVNSGRKRSSATQWLARRYRLLGVFYVVVGAMCAVVAWSGQVKWKH
jgi:hypothetical protein